MRVEKESKCLPEFHRRRAREGQWDIERKERVGYKKGEKRGVERRRESRSELAIHQEFYSVTYIQARGRIWIGRFVLFTNRNLTVTEEQKSGSQCGHLSVCMSVLVLEVSLPPAGHLSGPRLSVRWGPWLYSSLVSSQSSCCAMCQSVCPHNKVKGLITKAEQ